MKDLERGLEQELAKARNLAMDPANLASRPSDTQQVVLEDIETLHIYVVAGNQSFPAHQRVHMADGSYRPIAEVKPGDEVFTFDTKKQVLVKSTVLKLWENGIKPVNRYRLGNNGFLECTGKHEMVRKVGHGFYKQFIEDAPDVLYSSGEYEGSDTLNPDYVELLGFLLGDGCLTKLCPADLKKSGWARGIQFTNTNELIWNRVSELIGDEYTWERFKNGDGHLIDPKFANNKSDRPNRYLNNKIVEFIQGLQLDGHKAGSKFIPEVIYTQSLNTRRRMLAGLIETDGWVQNKKRIGFSTTSSQLAYDVQRLFASVGLFASVNRRKRNNPNHADEYTVQCSRAPHYNKFLQDIPMVSKFGETVKQKESYKPYKTQKKHESEFLEFMPVYDLTVDHEDHNFICEGVIVGNSGKTQMGARVLTWKFEETHPYWDRPADWGNEPLLLIVAGRISDQLNEIWRTKVEPMLTPGCYEKPHYSQKVIKSVTHKTNGNKILFTSHDKAEQAKDKVQMFVAHHFWLDEMPSHESYIEEAHRRVDARRGQFFATFTPKVRNENVRHMVDNADAAVAAVYRMGKLDNPIYKGREDEEWAKIAHLDPKVQKNIMFGDWLDADETVFSFNKDEHLKPLPAHYAATWPHVISYDPASSSNSGLTLFAFDHLHGQWWVVDSRYERHNSPSDHIEFLERYMAPYNIVRRVCDTEPWFYQEYHRQTGKSWIPIAEKTQRKKGLIAALQEALKHNKLLYKSGLTDLVREFTTAEWKAGYEGEKIKNSQRFHLIDSLQYGLDMLPVLKQEVASSYDASLMEASRASEAAMSLMSKARTPKEKLRVRRSFNRMRKKKGWFF